MICHVLNVFEQVYQYVVCAVRMMRCQSDVYFLILLLTLAISDDSLMLRWKHSSSRDLPSTPGDEHGWRARRWHWKLQPAWLLLSVLIGECHRYSEHGLVVLMFTCAVKGSGKGYLGDEVKEWLIMVGKVNCDEDKGSGLTSNFGHPTRQKFFWGSLFYIFWFNSFGPPNALNALCPMQLRSWTRYLNGALVQLTKFEDLHVYLFYYVRKKLFGPPNAVTPTTVGPGSP